MIAIEQPVISLGFAVAPSIIRFIDLNSFRSDCPRLCSNHDNCGGNAGNYPQVEAAYGNRLYRGWNDSGALYPAFWPHK